MKRTMGVKMRALRATAAASAAAFVFAFGMGVLKAQTPESPNAGWNPPSDAERCPSKWGPNDVRGQANHMGPKTVLRATQLIKTGQTFELGQLLKVGMPIIGNRPWHLQITNSGRRPGRTGSLEETLFTAIGQIGTQLDGFAHQMVNGGFYNCVKYEEVASANGIDKMGPDNFGTLMTRGVLIDVAALKDVPILGDTYAITAKDLQDALAREKLTLQPGDAVLIRTGWGKWWTDDAKKYLDRSPGLKLDAEEWLAAQDVMIVGSDNCCIEVRPVGIGPLIHQYFVAVKGIVVIENVKLDELAAAGANEFAFVVQPLKIWGATGSTVAPTAIR